ncbi:sensor histidine kinase [Flavihumibacter sp. UBA7668]|uniref:sensor histidine kinase n=1 Tax=Flavihumibacter sp. UBA7668 TaxID=1946542 RepID=UPI0025B8DCEE|nr:sensor histidine kinase [Flavihumibacter sp. UBA7668]
MKNRLLNIVYQHRFFLLFTLLFGYIASIQTRLVAGRELNAYLFTPEAALASFINALVIYFIMSQILQQLNKKQADFSIRIALQLLGTSLLIYLLFSNLFSYLIALAFDTVERNFNQQTLLIVQLNRLLDVFIYGGFFLAYSYYQKNKEKAAAIASYDQSISSSRIAQLKAQLNPHFLFNNLNVLDQLIDEDKTTASAFLNDFAELYRYVLESSDRKLVPLEEEWKFAQQYFRLMQHKYQDAYQLELSGTIPNDLLIPPLTLQLLLENAIEHNLGTRQQPIKIQVNFTESITVTNTLVPKPSKKTTGGRSLKNLQQQYALLSPTSISIRAKADQFIVSLPFIVPSKP